MPAQEEYHHVEEFLKLLFKGLFPLVFFVGGVVVLVSRIPGWGLILGLPMTVIGSALLINTFDEIARSIVFPQKDQETSSQNITWRKTKHGV